MVDDRLEAVTISDAATGETHDVATRALFVMVGAAPNSDWLSGLVALDHKSYVLTGTAVGGDSPFATSQPGIFSVGDVRAGLVKRVVSGVGERSVVTSKMWESSTATHSVWRASEDPSYALAFRQADRGGGRKRYLRNSVSVITIQEK